MGHSRATLTMFMPIMALLVVGILGCIHQAYAGDTGERPPTTDGWRPITDVRVATIASNYLDSWGAVVGAGIAADARIGYVYVTKHDGKHYRVYVNFTTGRLLKSDQGSARHKGDYYYIFNPDTRSDDNMMGRRQDWSWIPHVFSTGLDDNPVIKSLESRGISHSVANVFFNPTPLSFAETAAIPIMLLMAWIFSANRQGTATNTCFSCSARNSVPVLTRVTFFGHQKITCCKCGAVHESPMGHTHRIFLYSMTAVMGVGVTTGSYLSLVYLCICFTACAIDRKIINANS